MVGTLLINNRPETKGTCPWSPTKTTDVIKSKLNNKEIQQYLETMGIVGFIQDQRQVVSRQPYWFRPIFVFILFIWSQNGRRLRSSRRYLGTQLGRTTVPYRRPIDKTTIQGYRRLTASTPNQKEPVTPEIMAKLYNAHGQPSAALDDLRILFVCFPSF